MLFCYPFWCKVIYVEREKMRPKIGDIVEAAHEGVHGLAVGDQYVVIGFAENGGHWVQRVDDGQLPVNIKAKRFNVYPYDRGEVVCGYSPKELQVVGRYDYALAA